jgi:NMD protein affecting ribosome stability and mRNA decay
MGQNQYTKKSDLSKDRLCSGCGEEVRRIYDDKLCGPCYLKKKATERGDKTLKMGF